jgi:hypothetical protein
MALLKITSEQLESLKKVLNEQKIPFKIIGSKGLHLIIQI